LIVTVFAVGSAARRSGTSQGTVGNQEYHPESFAGYMANHGKNYVEGSREHTMREGLFNQRVAEVLAHNSAGHSWEMGLNMFSDWTEAELQSLRGYKRQHVGYSMPSSIMQFDNVGDENFKPAEKPENMPAGVGVGTTEAMDWSMHLATADDVLNQGPCGSCWAVAATAAIQLHAAKAFPGFNKTLSPENVNKCAPNPMQCGGEGGCHGSTPELAFEYVKSLGSEGGLYAMDSLPYTAATGSKIPEDGPICSKPGSSFLQMNNLRNPAAVKLPSVSIAGWTQVPANDAGQVMDALVNKGPLAVAIVGSGLQGYSKGVISGCNTNIVDHAVVMMGYGKDPETNMLFWNIRNSWGKQWGENGFFRLQRHYAKSAAATPATSVLQGGEEEPCGYDTDPAKGVACKNAAGEYPEKTWVCGQCGIISDVVYPTGVNVHPALLS